MLMEDILIWGSTQAEHNRLTEIYKQLKDFGMTLNAKKCVSFQILNF